MSNAQSGSFSLPKPVLGYHPGTFLERGASVPFTTPQLDGARARPGARGGLEFTVPNPSGGRGIYIVPSEGIFALCRPTMYDSRLVTLLSGMVAVTPTAIRLAARRIAAEGLAGRAARASAEAAIAAEQQSCMTVNFQLLLSVVAQVEAGGERPTGVDLERRARHALGAISPDLGRSTEDLATALEELAQLFANVGVGKASGDSRVQRIIASLEALRGEMREWARQHSDESGADAMRVAEAADVTLACLKVVMAEVHSLLRDMRALLRAWFANPQALSQMVVRPDWLVDGWERIILLWQTAATLGSGPTLAEMASLVPALPKEAAEWCRMPLAGPSETSARRRMVVMLEDWRTGITMYDVVARNEQILALTQ